MEESNKNRGAKELERMRKETMAHNNNLFARQWTDLETRNKKEVKGDFDD